MASRWWFRFITYEVTIIETRRTRQVRIVLCSALYICGTLMRGSDTRQPRYWAIMESAIHVKRSKGFLQVLAAEICDQSKVLSTTSKWKSSTKRVSQSQRWLAPFLLLARDSPQKAFFIPSSEVLLPTFAFKVELKCLLPAQDLDRQDL